MNPGTETMIWTSLVAVFGFMAGWTSHVLLSAFRHPRPLATDPDMRAWLDSLTGEELAIYAQGRADAGERPPPGLTEAITLRLDLNQQANHLPGGSQWPPRRIP